jgi:putative DNA methylase
LERRFIEESFPIKAVSTESESEKSVRHGHISLLHVWWARRPLAASRSTNYTSLISAKNNNFQNEKKFIENLSKWKNSSNLDYLEIARKNILQNFNGKRPKILDPFAGGGSIPLESLRLNCDTYANDYNPISTLILKCVIEYPQKFISNNSKKNNSLIKKGDNQLLKEFEKWQKWVIVESKKEIGKYYHEDEINSKVGTYWAHVIPCQNPSCKFEIPLLKQLWLDHKKNISLFPFIKNNKMFFKIVGPGYGAIPKENNPSVGTISKGVIVTCPSCQFRHDNKIIHRIFKENQVEQKMIVTILVDDKKNRKKFRLANNNDIGDFNNARKFLEKKQKDLFEKWGIDPIPNELVPSGNGSGAERAFNLKNYNIHNWSDVYNQRQLLSLIILSDKVRDAHELMIQTGYDKESSLILTTYLAFIVDRVVAYNNKLCKWVSDGCFVTWPFSISGLSFIFDYVESNPFSGSTGSWESAVDWIRRTLIHLTDSSQYSGKVTNHSATSLPYDNSFFDAVFTDPPYYDNYPYSYLSDFFYVWLKRSLGHLYPELFMTPLTPKSEEIVLYGDKEGGWDSGKIFFEDMLSKSFKEIFRVLKKEGIALIVYAHKSTDGWETLIKSILDSGLVVTAAWPIHTERKLRPRSNKSAALASSIYMVCRKLEKEPIGFYRDVKKELKNYLNKKLEQLWNEGISGADFFISAIGSAIEVFGKYEKVIDDSDEQIPILKLLDDTRKIVTNYAINKVIKGEFSDEISTMTRFYILWRWAYGEAKAPFDGASKMAQSVGIEIEHEWNKGFIVKDKEFIRVLGPDERTEKELSDPQDLIDILHKTLQIWKKGKMNEVDKFLEEKGYKNSEVFKRVAQAISESLPLESTEKKWLDGFLTGFKSEGSQSETQTKLF